MEKKRRRSIMDDLAVPIPNIEERFELFITGLDIDDLKKFYKNYNKLKILLEKHLLKQL